MTETPALHLKLLGAFRLSEVDGLRVPITSRKGMALIATLAMADDGERTRTWLQERLWGSRQAAQARGSLRRELHNLRAALNRGRGEILLCDRDRVRLNLEQIKVDARGTPPRTNYSREFLEGLDIAGEDGFEEWLREQRERLRAPPIAPTSSRLAAPIVPAMVRGPLLAVLPFDNLPSDPETAYFAEGVAEEILHALARSTDLRIIGRGSSFQFRGRDKAVGRVAAELGATHVLDGAVQRRNGSMRVTASLMEAADQTVAWTARYDSDPANLFELQDEIAEKVAEALQRVLAPRRGARSLPPDVHDRYLRARSLTLIMPRTDEAIALLNGVVNAAPDFAAGWAALALALATAARERRDHDAFAAVRTAAFAAADRADRLDPNTAAPLIARSLLEPFTHFAMREALVRRALAAAPTDPGILKHAADFSASIGRLREAHELTLRAREVDPIDPSIALAMADRIADLGRIGEAYGAYAQVRARWPAFGWALLAPLLLAAARAEWDVADALLDQAKILADTDGAFRLHAEIALRALRILRSAGGEAQRRELEQSVERQIARTGSVDLSRPGFIFNAGFSDLAFTAVERSSFDYARRGAAESVFLDGVIFSIANEPMRRDARFVSFCAKLGLCDYWVGSGRWPDCADSDLGYDFVEAARTQASGGALATPLEKANERAR